MNRSIVLLACVLSWTGCEGGRETPMIDLDAGAPSADGATASGARAPGAACGCDRDCSGTAAHPGVCVQGICMHRASADCASGGSNAECPAGSRCWGLEGFAGFDICWPDCASHTCAGTCDGDGSCVGGEAASCDASCSAVCTEDPDPPGSCPPNSHVSGDGCVCDTGFVVNADSTACVRECESDDQCEGELVCVDDRCRTPPCTATSCGDGQICAASGYCVIDLGTPPPGPVPSCAAGVGDVPNWQCTSGCGDLVPFDPATGPGYWNYPLNGETVSDQYRSYVRRDVMMLVKYATAMVACQAAGWTFGNGGALGLGDMSESNGAIPGTREGEPGHPEGTHVNGHDMDIAYYQVGTGDNRLRAICEHSSGGVDQYHCVGEPTMLDPWRTALFLAHLHVSSQVRVIGVDGKVGPLFESALAQLCADGWVSGGVCTNHSVTWEVTDTGRFWFRFHHHHLHLSVNG